MREIDQLARAYNLNADQVHDLRVFLAQSGNYPTVARAAARAAVLSPTERQARITQHPRLWYDARDVRAALLLDGAPWWLHAWHMLLADWAK